MAYEKGEKGDAVRVINPNSNFYGYTGVVSLVVDSAHTRERPHVYYRVELDGVTGMGSLVFREDDLERA